MEKFESSFGEVLVDLFKDRTRIELRFVDENDGGEAEAEMAMQEYIDILDKNDNGKFGKNEVGRAEIWENEDGTRSFVADIF